MNRATQLLVACILLLSVSDNALACKCATASKKRINAAANSALIFSGNLVVKKSAAQSNSPAYAADYSYQFVTDQFWRGSHQDTITLRSGSSNCAIDLQVGKRYIIFINPSNDLSICDRIITGQLEVERAKLDKLFQKPRFRKILLST
jgi:hypothetical protein